MAISPPRTPAPANGRAKNLSTPDILAAMMDSDSEDELVRQGPPTSRGRAPDLSKLRAGKCHTRNNSPDRPTDFSPSPRADHRARARAAHRASTDQIGLGRGGQARAVPAGEGSARRPPVLLPEEEPRRIGTRRGEAHVAQGCARGGGRGGATEGARGGAQGHQAVGIIDVQPAGRTKGLGRRSGVEGGR